MNQAIVRSKDGPAIVWVHKPTALWQRDQRDDSGLGGMQVVSDDQGEFIDLIIRRAAAMLEVPLPISP